MSQAVHPLIANRRDQMFPVLTPVEIDRLSRFGERRSYAAGEAIVTTGKVSAGAFLILAGHVEVRPRGSMGATELIVTHGPGSFMGELADLSGRPALVDGVAMDAVEAVVITGRRRWRGICARARKWRWWARAIPRARRWCICRARLPRFG
jgi:thioredoxin reductase (NADPH)